MAEFSTSLLKFSVPMLLKFMKAGCALVSGYRSNPARRQSPSPGDCIPLFQVHVHSFEGWLLSNGTTVMRREVGTIPTV